MEEKSWKEFMDSGILWFVNRSLHVFGWTIVIEIINDKVIRAFPARVSYRGFWEEDESVGFKKLTKYLKNNINKLEEEVNE